MQLKTDYKTENIPHAEHPAPQRMRNNWLNLNGKWQFGKVKIDEEPVFETEILVPFSPETLHSGIPAGFQLGKNEKLLYRRYFQLDSTMLLGKTVLHFGAVDSHAEVWVNGEKVGEHDCGFTAFSFDVTACVKLGQNEILVTVTDNFKHGARGKQSDKRGGIWYTAQSGIWQTVWLESMPQNHIDGLRFDVNAEEKTVKISTVDATQKTMVVYDGANVIATETFTSSCILQKDFELWSPENPKLYDVVICNEHGDELRSYFGVRSFGIAEDANGKKRLTLNGKPYFFSGVLDQGYWPDGLLTHPCDKALIDELTLLKKMGFNTVRKHIKVEPLRWYYHCDRLGLVVWQDFVNGGGDYKFWRVAAGPFLGVKHRDDDYAYFARENEQGRAEFAQMADDIIDSLYNCVSIGMWVIFNEGWGQFDSAKFTARVREKDNTRVIDSVSGWHDQGKEKTTLKSLHTYYTRLKVPKDPRVVVLSEYGGYSLKTEGHVFDEKKEFGYKKFASQQALGGALETLFIKKLRPLIRKGLSAAIYTQVSDVEEEINGLITYDRKIVKADVAQMQRLNAALYDEMQYIR